MEGTPKRRSRHSHTKCRGHGINGPGTAQPSSSLLLFSPLLCSFSLVKFSFFLFSQSFSLLSSLFSLLSSSSPSRSNLFVIVQVTQTDYMPFDPIVKRTEGSIKVSTSQHTHTRTLRQISFQFRLLYSTHIVVFPCANSITFFLFDSLIYFVTIRKTQLAKLTRQRKVPHTYSLNW